MEYTRVLPVDTAQNALGARAPSFDIEGMNNANKAASGVVAIILLTACAVAAPSSGQ
jgi:hypothetical protein